MYNKSVACFALFLALVEIGSCLDCFHCTSQMDPKCAATFTSTSKALSCESQDSVKFNQLNLYNVLPSGIFGGVQGAPKYCHKVVLETGSVIRTCLDGTAADVQQTCKTLIDESKSSPTDKKVKSCVACNKDNCNGAGSLSVSLPLSALTIVVSYLLYKQ